MFNSVHGVAGIVDLLKHHLSHANTELPFQLLLFTVYLLAGHTFVSIFVALLAAVAYLPYVAIIRNGISASRAMAVFIVVTLVATTASFRFLPRPELFDYILLPTVLIIMQQWTIKPDWRKLVLIAGIFALWAQTHISWTIGLFFVLVQFILTPRLEFFRDQLIVRKRHLLSALLTAGIAYALYKAVAFAWFVVKNLHSTEGIMFGITEMRPIWEFPEIFMQYTLVSGLLLLLSWFGGEGKYKRMVFFAVAYGVGVIVIRNVVFALLAMLPYAIQSICESERFIPVKRSSIIYRVLFACALLALMFFVYRPLTVNIPPRGTGVEWANFPRDAASYVREASLPRPIFNNWDCGGYLLWAWNGDPLPFLDGRLEDKQKLQDHEGIVDGTDPGAIIREYGFKTVLLQPLYYNSGRIIPAVYYFLSNGSWKLVRASDALVFTWREDSVQEGLPESYAWSAILAIARKREQIHDDAPHLLYTQGTALFHLGAWEEGRETFQRARNAQPELKGQYFMQ
jgi:hypothetical protein